jgi:thiol:disulfide interchange protein
MLGGGEHHLPRQRAPYRCTERRLDPEITALLQEFGRSGVPLYLLYDKAGVPTVLPQLLTEAMVLAALEKI